MTENVRKGPRGKRRWLNISFCFSHALLMMLICCLWMGVDYTLQLEEFQVKASTLLKLALFGNDKKFADEFVFIDVSGNKKLLPRGDGSGNDVITDRAKLDTFFQKVNAVKNADYKYILCNIFFDRNAPGDGQFEKTLSATKKLIIPKGESEDGVQLPVFKNVQSGLVSYAVSSGYESSENLVKYTLRRGESSKSIPLMMQENLTGQSSASLPGVIVLNGQAGFNRIIPDFRIQQSHLTDDSGRSRVIPLNYVLNLLRLNDTLFFNTLLRDKYIVIGNFTGDTHQTILGPMSGPLILSNVYLSLREGDHLLKISWLLYVLISFAILSWFFLYPPGWLVRLEKRIIHSATGIFFLIEEFFLAAFILWLISFGSYLIFAIHLDVVVLSIYMTLFLTFKKMMEKRKNARI